MLSLIGLMTVVMMGSVMINIVVCVAIVLVVNQVTSLPMPYVAAEETLDATVDETSYEVCVSSDDGVRCNNPAQWQVIPFNGEPAPDRVVRCRNHVERTRDSLERVAGVQLTCIMI